MIILRGIGKRHLTTDQYPVVLRFTVGINQPLLDPLNDMVLDNMMEEIRNYFVLAQLGKMHSGRLNFVS